MAETVVRHTDRGRLLSAVAASFVLAIMGCSGSLIEEPDWDQVIVLSPGVFVLSRGDSLFAGFGFWLADSDGGFFDCAPDCIERIEVFSPCWDSYVIDPGDFMSIHTCDRVSDYREMTCYRQVQYWDVEHVDSACSGFYSWEVELAGGRVLTARDHLTVAPYDFPDACFLPADGADLPGSRVEFSVNTDVPIGGLEISIHDETGASMLTGEWVASPQGSKFTATHLSPDSQYFWKARVWDRGKCKRCAWSRGSGGKCR